MKLTLAVAVLRCFVAVGAAGLQPAARNPLLKRPVIPVDDDAEDDLEYA